MTAYLSPAQRDALRRVAGGTVRLMWPHRGRTLWTLDAIEVPWPLSRALDDAYSHGLIRFNADEAAEYLTAPIFLTDAGRAALAGEEATP